MASSLDEFIQTVQKLSASGNYVSLCEVLNKSVDLLVKNLSQLDNVLHALNTKDHTVGVLAVLHAKLSDVSLNNILFPSDIPFSQIEEFVVQANRKQVQLLPDMFSDVLHSYAGCLVKVHKSHRGIYTLREALYKLQETPTHLTTLHSELCRLCLHAKNLKPAVKLLNCDITAISKEGGQYFEAKPFLLYYYYGGMIYTALKNYDRALYFFEVCITTPALAVSQIMLEAYKKYILVLLILEGKLTHNVKGTPRMQVHLLPRNISQIVARYIKPRCQPYLEIATAFQTGNSEQLQEVVQRYNDRLSLDKNMGLAKLAISASYKQNINRLTKTFLTLSLADVANRTKLWDAVEAEKYVFRMTTDGEIYAGINQKDGMIVFKDSLNKYNTLKELKEIEEQVQECIEIDNEVCAMDDDISVNINYIKKVYGSPEEDSANQKLPSNFIL